MTDKSLLEIAYANLSANEVEIEFLNLISLINSYLEQGNRDAAIDTLIELEVNVEHTRSERKMNMLYFMEKKVFNTVPAAVLN